MRVGRVQPWVAGMGGSFAIHLLIVAVVLALRPSSKVPAPSPPARVAPVELVRLRVLDRRPAVLEEPVVALGSSTPRTRPVVTGTSTVRVTPSEERLAVPVATPTEAAADAEEARADGVSAPSEVAPGEAHGGNGTADRSGGPALTAQVPEVPTGPSAATVAELHALLSRVAKDCYPERARRFRQTARVPLSFCVGAQGQPHDISVAPSGVGALDEAARSCVVAHAAPFPDVSRGFCFTVAVEFRE